MQSHWRHDVCRASQLGGLVFSIYLIRVRLRDRPVYFLLTRTTTNTTFVTASRGTMAEVYPLRSSYLSREKSDGCEDGVLSPMIRLTH